MTTKEAFTDEEWMRVVRAPFVAGLAITLADPGGPIEAAKETMATLKAATNPPTHEQLLAEVALEIQAETQQHHHPLKGFRPDKSATTVGAGVLEEIREVRSIVAAKATPEETTAFATWLTTAAQAAAEAAKEGGFMGFHAEQISEREHGMLDQVTEVVSG